MKVELHLLQNFPPHNLNRDETGTPKDCEFGGERRARISSQCFKRAIRTSPVFETLDERIAIRTKRSSERIAKLLREEHGRAPREARALAEAAMSKLVSDVDEEGKTNVLYYVSHDELEDLAQRVHESASEIDAEDLDEAADTYRRVLTDGSDADGNDADDSEEVDREDAREPLEAALDDTLKDFVKANKGWARSTDVALFGRMLAEEPDLNLDAACQVAHALSTNRVAMEFDFFTAVDDLNPDAETGAGMIGSTGFNSSCFYRYLLVDVDQLAKNLSPEDDATSAGRTRAADGTRAFLRAAIAALPTGKQNSFAAQARPALALAVARPERSMPMSLVNAFEAPAAPQNGHSLVSESARKLVDHWTCLQTMYGGEGSEAFLAMLDDLDRNGVSEAIEASNIERSDTVHQVIDGVLSVVEEETSS
jgi:CRISPR system Cascade subunit CasC